MTVLRLDSSTLAKLQSASERLILADEAGTPRWRCSVSPVEVEPAEIENDPTEYSLEEVWSQVRAAMERSFQEPGVRTNSHLQRIGI